MHVDLGFDAEDSVVTVLVPSTALGVIAGDRTILTTGVARFSLCANAPSNNAILTGGSATVVLNPEHSLILHKEGLSRQEIANELYERCFLEPEMVKRLMPAFAGENPSRRMAFKGPEQILILQAGGSGLYSMVMPSWSAGTHANSAVSVKVEADNFCEIPGLAGS